MKLTPFSHTALAMLAGMLISLFAAPWGHDIYGIIVFALGALVLVGQWSVKATLSSETRDDPEISAEKYRR